jgi:hypothetical protein
VTFVLELPGGPVAVTNHALERYGERVRPHMAGYRRLHADMVRLVGVCGSVQADPPAWVKDDRDREGEREGCFVACGDICLVVQESPEGSRFPAAVTTVLARGHMGDVARAKRNSRRAARTWRNGKKVKLPRRRVNSANPILESE